MKNMQKLKIFSGNANRELSQQIADHIGIELGKCEVNRFADGEVQVDIKESVRGRHVFIVQSTCPPVNENYMELFILIDAFRRASAKYITAVIPYYGYSRQDRKSSPRAPISAKCMADLLSVLGIDRLLSIDLHASQIQGFFHVPVDHLYAFPTFAKHWSRIHSSKGFKGRGEESVSISPDAGGVERCRAFAKLIHSSIAFIDKRRVKANEISSLQLVGEVEGKQAIIVDDMIDTAGTITKAAHHIKKDKKAKKIFVIGTHALFSPPAIQRIENSPIEEVWVSNSIPLSAEAKKCKKIKVISIAPVIADAIHRIYNKGSVSKLFNELNEDEAKAKMKVKTKTKTKTKGKAKAKAKNKGKD